MSEIDSKGSKSDSPKSGGSEKASADKAVNKALSNAGKGTATEGANFHTDSTAGEAAGALGAKAFTAGNDVYFGQGQYQPDTKSGADLINHEMTHVSQSQGVAAPTPGNFKVSSPGDSTEVAARSGAQGVTGTANTIYRDGEGTPATTGTGPAAEGDEDAGGGGEAGGADAAGGEEAEEADPYDDWKAAAQARQRADAVTKWAKVPGSDKGRFTGEDEAFQRSVIRTMQEDSMKVFKEANVDVGPFSHTIFQTKNFAQFLPKMRANGQVNTFLDAEPLTTHLSQSYIASLKTWSDQATAKAESVRIFQKVYPTLHDSFPGAGRSGATALAWTPVWIKKLFNVLMSMPVGHASTLTGGFVLVGGLGFGFYRPSEKRVFIPNSSESAGHDMSGGTRTGTDNAGNATGASISPDFTAPDGTKKTANMGHFSATIIHEIGHGVGDRLDGGRGNAYAENPSSWPGFTVGMSFDTWANELWTNGATGSGSEPTVHRNAKLDDAHAKEFVKSELQSGQGSYSPGWVSNPPRSDMATYVKWRYMSVPLVRWWDYFVERGNSAADSYTWDEPAARIKGSWAYARLTRGGSGWSKFKKAAWDQKVSWYSLSSPREWFAEQYTQFYRTEKTGAGIDGTTLTLLKDLDKLEFANTGGDDGVTITNQSDGAASGSGDSDSGGGSDGGIADAGGGDSAAAAAEGGSSDGSEDRPLMFPW